MLLKINMIIVRTLVKGIVNQALDYFYPDSNPILYTRVLVPLKNRKLIAFIIDINPKNLVNKKKIKKIYYVIDHKPIISNNTVIIIRWISMYYKSFIYQTLKLAIPKLLFKENITLQKDNTVTRSYIFKDNNTNEYIFSNQQKQVIVKMNKLLSIFNTILLNGVPGSGKKEIYLESMKNILKDNGQVMILIPEIHSTPEIFYRLQKKFNNTIIEIYHSKLTDKERFNLWLKAKKGNINIIITTRSGIFLDIPNLKMIIVDEEHHSSYKHKIMPLYHARDVAIFKAKLLNIPIILVSSTPSIESYFNAISGKYFLISIEKKIINNINIINLKNNLFVLSKILIMKIQNVIDKGYKVILMINRRGFSNRLICKKCGWYFSCHDCEKPLTLHKYPQYLSCNVCGKSQMIITECYKCKSNDLMDFGIGIEKIEEVIRNNFPNAAIVRLDSSVDQLKNKINKIKHNDFNIIIGTKIISQINTIKNVQLIGIINIDFGFYSQDFHALERVAQLMMKFINLKIVSQKSCDVYIQTYKANNHLLNLILKNKYYNFLNFLLKSRKILNYPPFTYQVYIYAKSVKREYCINILTNIYNDLYHYKQKHKSEYNISSILPAINIKTSGYYFFMLIMTSKLRSNIHYTLNFFYKNWLLNKKVKIIFDIDPIFIR